MRTALAIPLVLAFALAGCASTPDAGPDESPSGSPSPASSTSASASPTAATWMPSPRPTRCNGEPAPIGQGDWSTERVNVTLQSAGPFTVRVALWVAPPATGIGSWSQVLQWTGGMQQADTETQDGGDGHFEVRGSGPTWVSGCLERGSNACCAEEWLKGHWSLDPEASRQAYPSELVSGGPVTVSIDYRAQSRACGAHIQANGTLAAHGAATLPAEALFSCT